MKALLPYASALALLVTPWLAAAEAPGEPLTAIEWLQDALNAPPPPAVAPDPPRMDERAPVQPPTHFETITVLPLTGSEPDSTGLFRAERIGLPRDFWGPTPVADILSAIEAMPGDTLPSAARLGLRLLMAEFAPPEALDVNTRGTLLLARIDRLISLGALEQASQLIDAAPEPSAALRARAFDIALLLGEEDRACAAMSREISVQDAQAAKIFCTARRGDWQAAWSGLQVARSLGLIDPVDAGLLERFLEEEEAEFTLPAPQTITPLGWRILEALGDPVPTATLPVAFAHADLRGISGWRAQIDAAERLARMQVLQANRLHGLYTQRRPAASGGMWERVRAVQSLEQALARGDTEAISNRLIAAWPLFKAVELETAFATIHAEDLATHDLDSTASAQVWEILLLAQDRLERAAALTPDSDLSRFVMALAASAALPRIDSPDMANAIHAGLTEEALPESLQIQIADRALGLVVLDALRRIAKAAAGDPQAARLGLQALRAAGLEAEARQIAVELLLLDRRG